MTARGLVEAASPTRVAGWAATSTKFVDIEVAGAVVARVRLTIERPDVAEANALPETTLGFEFHFTPSLPWEFLASVTVRTAEGLILPRGVPDFPMRDHRELMVEGGWSPALPAEHVVYPPPMLGFPSATTNERRRAVERSFVLEALNRGADIGVLTDATLLGAQGALAVGGSLVADSAYLLNPEYDAPGVYRKPDGAFGLDLESEAVRYEDRPILSVLGGGYSGYYHWLLDVLLRLGLAKDARTEGRVVVLPEIRTQFAADSLSLLGLPLHQVAFCGRRDVIRASNAAWVSSPLHQWHPAEGFADAPGPALREAFREQRVLPARTDPGAARAVYISRRDATKRRLVNEADVERALEARGYRVLRLTGMPMAEQIAAFSNVEVIIGPHGAGLTNLVFAPRPTTVIELASDAWVNPCYHRLAAAGGDRYAAWVCRTLDDKVSDEHERTMSCDVPALGAFLDQLGV